MKKIDELWVYIAVNHEDQCEGIVGAATANGWMPLVCNNPKTAELMKPQAIKVSEDTGKTILLKYFKGPVTIEVIEPKRH